MPVVTRTPDAASAYAGSRSDIQAIRRLGNRESLKRRSTIGQVGLTVQTYGSWRAQRRVEFRSSVPQKLVHLAANHHGILIPENAVFSPVRLILRQVSPSGRRGVRCEIAPPSGGDGSLTRVSSSFRSDRAQQTFSDTALHRHAKVHRHAISQRHLDHTASRIEDGAIEYVRITNA
jgi:hypothetical protein